VFGWAAGAPGVEAESLGRAPHAPPPHFCQGPPLIRKQTKQRPVQTDRAQRRRMNVFPQHGVGPVLGRNATPPSPPRSKRRRGYDFVSCGPINGQTEGPGGSLTSGLYWRTEYIHGLHLLLFKPFFDRPRQPMVSAITFSRRWVPGRVMNHRLPGPKGPNPYFGLGMAGREPWPMHPHAKGRPVTVRSRKCHRVLPLQGGAAKLKSR